MDEEYIRLLNSNKLQELFDSGKYLPFLAFDDKDDNLTVFKKFGFKCFNAIQFNKKLTTQLELE